MHAIMLVAAMAAVWSPSIGEIPHPTSWEGAAAE
jgi:hypothetical protein